jgi:restriction system protein
VQFKFKISENSLFSILMRSSWWISFAVAAILLVIVQFVVPGRYLMSASSLALPFLIIGAITGWKQFRLPGAARIAATVEAVKAMPWREFSGRVEQAYSREGYAVTRLTGAADFRLVKMGKTTLLCCKRWKAASHGLEPLRELERRREAEEAHDALYVALDGVTDNARAFIEKRRVRLIEAQELTGLLGGRGQRFERTEDRKTGRPAFRPSPGAKRPS